MNTFLVLTFFLFFRSERPSVSPTEHSVVKEQSKIMLEISVMYITNMTAFTYGTKRGKDPPFPSELGTCVEIKS